MDNRISFTSTINFVTGREFAKTVRKCHTYIPYEPYEADTFYKIANSFFTTDIRTCSAGGFSDGIDFALGLHILDSFNNNKYINIIKNTIKNKLPDRPLHGLLIGSKNLVWRNLESPKNFAELKNFMQKNAKYFSYFEEHNSAAESNIHYGLINDTWTINTKAFDKRKELYYDVITKYELLKVFKDIHISDGDILMIKGQKIDL